MYVGTEWPRLLGDPYKFLISFGDKGVTVRTTVNFFKSLYIPNPIRDLREHCMYEVASQHYYKY
jgi:hypothetical protein